MHSGNNDAANADLERDGTDLLRQMVSELSSRSFTEEEARSRSKSPNYSAQYLEEKTSVDALHRQAWAIDFTRHV
ncbi:MAG: hypothetical protein P4M11_10210 [Candidatus Pacebacteria bacterium]|nr:hypothetical protein [Candidatus Paceibacterota bacterium]